MMWFRKVRLTSKSICLISDEKLFACSFICWKGEGQTRGRNQTPSQPVPLSTQGEGRIPAAGVAAWEQHRAIQSRAHWCPPVSNELQPGGEPLTPCLCHWPREKGMTPHSHPKTAAAANPAFTHLPMQILSFQNLKPLQFNSSLIYFDFSAWLDALRILLILKEPIHKCTQHSRLFRGSIIIKSKLLWQTLWSPTTTFPEEDSYLQFKEFPPEKQSWNIPLDWYKF